MDPDRRSLLTAMLGGIALLGPDAASADAAVQSEPPDPSVYIPKAHLVQDRAFLHAFMDEFSFVDLVTTTPTLRITHIPSGIAVVVRDLPPLSSSVVRTATSRPAGSPRLRGATACRRGTSPSCTRPDG